MMIQLFSSSGRAAGIFLVVAGVASLVGVVLFTLRGGAAGGSLPSPTYLVWERSLLIAAVIVTAMGFVLLGERLSDTEGRVLARLGASAYSFAGVLVVAAETLVLVAGLRDQQVYPLVVTYVVLAFLAQAAIGGALLQSGLLAMWIAWVAIAWSLAFLVGLLLVTPEDVYFPILHHLIPLLIGGALLWRTPQA